MPVLLVQCGVFNIGAKNELCGTSACLQEIFTRESVNSCGLFSVPRVLLSCCAAPSQRWSLIRFWAAAVPRCFPESLSRKGGSF